MCIILLHYTIIFVQVLNQVTPNCEETKSLAAQKNEHKNRTMKYLPRKKYNSNNLYICTLLHSLADNHRVLLRQEDSDYIHASFVNVSTQVLVHAVLLHVHCIILSHVQGYKHKKAFIIAQSPMENTVKDFWKMIVERECTAVVMLCGFEEDGQVSMSISVIYSVTL